MRAFLITIVVFTVLEVCSSPGASAEEWDSFSGFISQVDYVAQRQQLVRDGQVIGTRTVHEYWKSKDFDESLIAKPSEQKAWSFSEYNCLTDRLTTTFEFYGRNHLWTVGQINGAVLYPGISTDGSPGAEVACSVTEFHELLLQIAALKAKGKGITGLPLPRLGSLKPAVP